VFYQELEEKVCSAGQAFEAAGSDNIVNLGEQYLACLEGYLSKLYEHPAAPGHAPPQPVSPSSYEAVASVREALRSEVDRMTAERDRVSVLVHSFKEMSVGDAVETLNAQRYKGRDTWRIRGGVVTDGGRERMSVEQAVDAAGFLRREAYVSRSGRTELADK
jgi:hypothetical protein